MIIDLPRFIQTERPTWTELESLLDDLASQNRQLSLADAQRFHFLFQKVSADLGRVNTFASEPAIRRYLESLVARSYAEIHETRGRNRTWRPFHWFFVEFPAVFRRHVRAFWISILISFLGAIFGGTAVLFDDEAKYAIVPPGFEHVLKDPAQRVAEEESATEDAGDAQRATFAGHLMQNNITVSIRALAFGMTWGVLTVIVLLYNGIMLGQVVFDYINAGQGVFLAAWLLPHGSIELPAIFIAGQGGLVLARAMIGRGDRAPLSKRLRAVSKDVMTIIGGVAIMLVWAGIVESYMSQHHEPRLPYWIKITFGSLELIALTLFLSSPWRRRGKEKSREVEP